jgi:hypothetical protein
MLLPSQQQPWLSHALSTIGKRTPAAAAIDKHLMPGNRKPTQSGEPLWLVQDILAERTSLTGDKELLVVWKPSWEPASNVQHGPAMTLFRATPKWEFTSCTRGMRVLLPVERNMIQRNTALAVDRAGAKQKTHPKSGGDPQSGGEQQSAASASGPRKSLGIKSKRRNGDEASNTSDSASTSSSHSGHWNRKYLRVLCGRVNKIALLPVNPKP